VEGVDTSLVSCTHPVVEGTVVHKQALMLAYAEDRRLHALEVIDAQEAADVVAHVVAQGHRSHSSGVEHLAHLEDASGVWKSQKEEADRQTEGRPTTR
jgi:hypothetical protein